MDDDDPFAGLGLVPVALSDAPTFQPFLASLSRPLSDYTFSQIYSWRNSLRILWRLIDGHLCVFANGAGDLTLLMPPIGEGNSSGALASAFDVMDQYNAAKKVPDRSRVEYISEELLPRFACPGMVVAPQGADYVYDTARMIDLAGGDLASKRQAKNRFLRNYGCRVETYDPRLHLSDCEALLDRWKNHQDSQHDAEASINAIKRQKETTATELTLRCAAELGLRGMVVYVRDPKIDRWTLGGFTFGENLGQDQASITIEKTDLQIKGLAQFIFSEFCAREWVDRPLTNVGDDWGLETLAWTKQSYRPVAMLKKFTVQRSLRASIAVPDVAAPSKTIESSRPAVTAGVAEMPEVGNAPAIVGLPLMLELPRAVELPTPSPCTQAEGGGEASGNCAGSIAPEAKNPHPNPLPGYREREQASSSFGAVRGEEIVIRPAVRSDVQAVDGIEQTCFERCRLRRRQLQYLQSSRSAVFFVAEQNGQIVGEGIALVRQHRRQISGRIYSLAVRPDQRGRGIGAALLKILLEALAHRGVKRIYLEVQEHNEPALALYRSAGFETIDWLRDYYGPGLAARHMLYAVSDQAMLPFAAA